MRVAGLISGTSLDGIDVAVVDIGDTLQVIAATTVPYPPGFKEALLSLPDATSIGRMNFRLGELFAEAVPAAGVPLETIALIGSHGQTIYHESGVCTMQIGEGAVIAERTGIPVVSDFRTADIAAGGSGAPLAPFLDFKLFRHPTISRVALNIGGIANITVLPASAGLDEVIAFDTGPGNMVMDALAPPFDRNGENAAAGRVNEDLLAALLRDRYYDAAPPKSCGREQYGADFVARTGIDIATATELTARTIARAIGRYPDTREIIVSGGGAHNLFLMERLRALISARVLTSAELGIDIDSKEAVLFALLAHETWNGRPSNVPSATGARHPAILGKISHPYRTR